MAEFPAMGQKPYYDDLKAYLEGLLGLAEVGGLDMGALPTYVYGNSYGTLTGSYFTGAHYTQRAAAAANGGEVTSYAVGGRRIADVVGTLIRGVAPTGSNGAIAAGLWPGTTARTGAVVIDSLFNDIAHYASMAASVPSQITSANTRYVDGVKAMVRAALALASSETRVEATSAVTSGAWTNTGLTYASAGTVSYTTAVGGAITYTVTPPQEGALAGKVFHVGYRIDPAVANNAATVNVSVDGGAATPVAITGWEQYTGHAGTAVSVTYDCIPVTLPADGASHTVRLEHAGTAGHFFYSDCVLVPSEKPNPIRVMGREKAPGVDVFDAAGVNAYRYNATVLTPKVKEAVAEFPNAQYVPSTMTAAGFHTDGLHPNDVGMAQIANDLLHSLLVHSKPALLNRFATA